MSLLKLRERIKDVKIAMFTTTDHEGMIRSRPLQTLDTDAREGVAELWFFSSNNENEKLRLRELEDADSAR